MRSQAWLGAVVCALAVTAASDGAADEEVIALFNGKSLDGWTTADGRPVSKGWSVEDGMLVRESRGGAIYTDEEYGDFELSFQWKIAQRGNSGIKYRVRFYKKGVRGNPGWLGCEYQVFDDLGRDTNPKTSCGAIYGLYAPSEEKQLRPAGEFNDSRIVVRGTKIEHWLNGEKVVEADTSSHEWRRRIAGSKFSVVDGFFENPKGRIQIQDHGSKVWFRNVTLRRLD